jgi:hypothetical protein
VATYVLIPGADGRAWYWRRVIPLLQQSGHEVVAVEFQRRVVSERLGIPIEEIPGGHLVALSRPSEVAEKLQGRG